jgi:hypothetical protein
MSTSTLEKIASISEPIKRAAHKVEGGLGMFFGTFLTLMLAGFVVYMYSAWGESSDAERALLAAGASGWLFLDVPYLVRLWRVAFRGPPPITFEAAARQPVAPVPLRPVIAAWWLAHFSLAVAASLMTAAMVLEGEPVLVHTVQFVLATSYGYAANGYLMNAICALTRSPTARQWVWRRRGLVDVALGVIGALVPPAMFN